MPIKLPRSRGRLVATAYHEAGHAAVALANDIYVTYVRLGDRDSKTDGVCDFLVPGWLIDALEKGKPLGSQSHKRLALARKYRLVYLAGWLADEHRRHWLCLPSLPYSFWDTTDGEWAIAHARLEGRPKGWAEADKRTVRNTLRWLWPIVEAIAQALLENPRHRLRESNLRKIAVEACLNPQKFKPKVNPNQFDPIPTCAARAAELSSSS